MGSALVELKMALTAFDRVRQLYDFQMWNSLAEFSSLFAGVVSASESSGSVTASETASAAVASLPAKQKVALQVMVAHALIENKEFARAEALLKDTLQHRET